MEAVLDWDGAALDVVDADELLHEEEEEEESASSAEVSACRDVRSLESASEDPSLRG